LNYIYKTQQLIMLFSRIYLAVILTPCLLAQTIDTPIFEQSNASIKKIQNEIIERALVVREKVCAIDKEEIDKQLLAPTPEPIKLPPILTKELSPEEIAEHARAFNLRVGYCYKCISCENWHINLAGGYAIAPNIIVTCDHVLATKTKMRDGFIVAVDHAGNIACGTAVLARNPTMDAAIIKVSGTKFTPVPLSANVKQGSLSYCFSYPLKQQGYFSIGVINRFYWHNRYQNQDKKTIDGISYLRMNYSNDWAPGSSGSPLFDNSGNVTGHVSTISSLSNGKNSSPMITLHEGIPARAIQTLAAALDKPEEIARVANFPIIADKLAKENPEDDDKPAAEEKPDLNEKPEALE
jgi:V8-like Glu-specific endopeptidase